MRLQFLIILFFTLLCFVPVRAQNADIDGLRKINLHRNKSLDPAFKFVSNSVYPLAIGVPVGTAIYALIKRDSSSRRQAIIFASSVLVAGVLTYSLKYAVNRKRPYESFSDIDNLSIENSPSFPSAHTSFAFSLATAASIQYKKWYVVVPAFAYAGLVGYSRLHMGVHYPSDVFAGALVGCGSAWLSYKLNYWLFEKKSKQRQH